MQETRKKSKVAPLVVIACLLMAVSIGCFAACGFFARAPKADMTLVAESAARVPSAAAVETILPEPEPVLPAEPVLPPAPQPYLHEDGCWYIDLMEVPVLLVNKVFGLPESFGGTDPAAEKAMYDMFSAAEAEGVYLYLCSGYRSYQYQYDLHAAYTERWGDEYTDRVSAEAGHSEHQTGMAFDILSYDHPEGLTNSFKDSAGGMWLKEHCHEYGFILRYPEGKETLTGYIFEPWHFRYLGDNALAKAITDSGLCLEEYAGILDFEIPTEE